VVFAVELIEVNDVPDLEDPFRDQDHVRIKQFKVRLDRKFQEATKSAKS
jgi:hypothetical protein